MSLKENGMMFILSSPSGAGKTTLTKKLSANNKNFVISVSHTTRKSRPNEIDGKDYHFVDESKFNLLIKSKNFFEYAKIFNNYYGTLKQPVIDLLSQGKDVLFDIDWQGTQQFILPPNKKVLKERLLTRHEGQEKMIIERMNKFTQELSHWNEYNYVVVNDDLEECYNKILNIIISEKKGKKEIQDMKEIKSRIDKLMQ